MRSSIFMTRQLDARDTSLNKFLNALEQDAFVITTELTPPKGTDLSGLFDKADMLKERVTAFNLTESHAARMAMDPVAVGRLLLDRGLEPIVQMTSRDKNRIAIQASMLGAAALGIRNLVFMGGDPPKNGDHPDAKPVFDMFASQLLEAALALNSGRDFMGNALNAPTDFYVGAVVNPGAADIATEIENAHRKADAGASFFQTQAIYDTDSFLRFMDAAKLSQPVLAGIIPIKSVKMARYMNEKIPGVDIPEVLVERIGDAGEDTKRVAEISIEIAASTIKQLKGFCRGVHIMAIGWEDNIPFILDSAGVRPSP
jgi:5,10-methylenetetrahydrofolate reductase